MFLIQWLLGTAIRSLACRYLLNWYAFFSQLFDEPLVFVVCPDPKPDHNVVH
jgi:hypothetical protein